MWDLLKKQHLLYYGRSITKLDFDINTWAAGIGIAVITAVSVAISVRTWQKSSESQTYSNLDTLYQNMLWVGIENPKVRVEKTSYDYPNTFKDDHHGQEDKAQYDTYAIMVWDFYESLCDDAIGLKNIREKNIQWDKLEDDVNWVSYLPSFNHDAKLYWKWFEKNYSIFKIEFRMLLKKLIEKNMLKNMPCNISSDPVFLFENDE